MNAFPNKVWTFLWNKIPCKKDDKKRKIKKREKIPKLGNKTMIDKNFKIENIWREILNEIVIISYISIFEKL